MTTTPALVRDDDGPESSDGRYAVGITGSGLHGGYLCLLYAATPVPLVLVGDTRLHVGDDVALAVDERRHLYRGGQSAYRTSASGARVVGAIKLGPEDWEMGDLRVLFSPFACAAGLEKMPCEAHVLIDAHGYGRRLSGVIDTASEAESPAVDDGATRRAP